MSYKVLKNFGGKLFHPYRDGIYSPSLKKIYIFTRSTYISTKFGGNWINIVTYTIITHIHTENLSSHEIGRKIRLSSKVAF